MTVMTSRLSCAVTFAEARRGLLALCALLLLGVGAGVEAADEVAGRFQFVLGDVRVAAADGLARPAFKGAPVYQGDTVTTGPEGWAQLRMKDEAQIALRQDSKLRIEAYMYAGREEGGDSSVLGLIKGGFRTLTGLIGKNQRNDYRVRTATATIGIRGTDHEPVYVPVDEGWSGAPGADAGTYDRVHAGATYVENPAGRIDLDPNQVGFVSPLANIAPVRLEKIPDFFRAVAVTGARATGSARKDDSSRRADAEAKDKGGPRATSQPITTGQGPLARVAAAMPSSVIQQVILQDLPEYAPDGHALAGGDKSGPFLGAGAGMVGNGDDTTVLLGGDGNPLVITDNKGRFRFLRATAPLVDAGQAEVGGTSVRWGIYAGGKIFNADVGQRDVDFFHFMSAAQALPQAAVAGFSGSYDSVVGFTRPVTELGLGPASGSVASHIVIVGGTLKTLNLAVTDSFSRNWIATSLSSPALADFIANGVNVAGAGAAGKLDTTVSQVYGGPVGATGGAFIGAYSLTDTAMKAVTGSFVAR